MFLSKNPKMKYEEIEKRQCFRSSGTKEDVPGIIHVSSVIKKGKHIHVLISESKTDSFQKCRTVYERRGHAPW